MTRRLEEVAILVAIVAMAVGTIGGTIVVVVVVVSTNMAVAVVGRHVELVSGVLDRVLQVGRQRRVAHAVRLGRSNVAIVRSGRVHGSGKARGTGDLASVHGACIGSLAGVRRTVTRDGDAAGVGGKARLTLLNLALNAATVRSLADTGQDRAHGVDEVQADVGRSKLKRSLDDIVAILIAHKLLELLSVHHLLNHHSLGGAICAADALLDDVGAELLLRKLGNVTLETEAERRGEGHVVEIEDVLNNVVA